MESSKGIGNDSYTGWVWEETFKIKLSEKLMCFWDESYRIFWGWRDAHWVRTLAAKPDDLRSSPGTHRAEGENRLQKLFFDLHMP